MKKHLTLFILFITLSISGKSDKQQKIDDEIKIGNQIWMTKNLDVNCFRNGIKIAEVKSIREWEKAFENKTPVWCYYDFKRENEKKYGKIYNWYAVINSNGLAPTGWRVPQDKDWRQLFEYLGGEDNAGNSLKSTTGWKIGKNKGKGNNSSGFNAKPGGYFDPSDYTDIYGKPAEKGGFKGIGKGGHFWGIMEEESKMRKITDKVHTSLWYEVNYVETTLTKDDVGYSVRCIK